MKTVTEVEAKATTAAATSTETTDYISKITIISRHFSKETPWSKLAKNPFNRKKWQWLPKVCASCWSESIETEIGLVSPCWFSDLINLLDSSFNIRHICQIKEKKFNQNWWTSCADSKSHEKYFNECTFWFAMVFFFFSKQKQKPNSSHNMMAEKFDSDCINGQRCDILKNKMMKSMSKYMILIAQRSN